MTALCAKSNSHSLLRTPRSRSSSPYPVITRSMKDASFPGLNPAPRVPSAGSSSVCHMLMRSLVDLHTGYRHQLVPQPEHHSNGPRPPNAGPGSPHRRAGSGSSTANGSASGSGAGGGGVLSSFFNMVSGGSTGNSSGSGSSHPSSSHSSEQPRDPPGGWRD